MAKVVLVRCTSYDIREVDTAIRRGIELLGGLKRFSRKDERILLKPNLLAPDPPERGTTTHPSVFRAACRIFKESGARVSYGDSPARGSSLSVATHAGLQQVAAEEAVPLDDFQTVVEVSHKEGRQNKKFSLAKAVVEADGVISLPRFKTHALEKITGGVKNQFGCVPGFLKAEFHAKLTNAVEFGRMLVDLTNLVRPRLYILDAVYAMEGNGPRSGNLRKMNLLMLSEDPVALDATACRLIDVDPTLIPTIVYGEEFGCGTFQKEEIQLEGDSFEEFFCPEFDVDRGPIEKYVSGSGSKLAVVLLAIVKTKVGNRLFHKLLITKPVIDAAKCVKCGICVQICPTRPKSVDWIEGDKSRPPRHDYERCIRCFCCQETCPEGAIYVKKPLLRKIVADY
ncbi:MAG: DUF362 domain-containing protein [Spirochaetaceae bacterium]|nr:MAG: DUF362 domain-containing protein [Spirochaetaceae bacterium]